MTVLARDDGQWVGAPLTPAQIVAVMIVATVGVMVAGVQPILLGSLHSAGRIGEAQIGHAATLELLALAAGIGIGSALLEGRRIGAIMIGASLVLALGNLATLWADGVAIVLLRALCGLAGGIMMWTASALIVRSPSPTRWSSIYLIVQAAAQCAVATGAATWSPGNPNTIPWTLAGLAAFALLFVSRLPQRFDPLPKEPTASGLPPLRGWMALAVMAVLQAAILGAWVYFEPLGEEAGMTAGQIAFSTPLSLGCQLIGGGLAILLASRVSWPTALGISSVLLALNLVSLSLLPSPLVFLALQAAFGALWMFITPYLTPFAIESDPTRRTALLANAAVLFGSAVGPLIASQMIGIGGASGVLQICAGLAIVGMLLIQLLHLTGRSAAARMAAGLR